MLQPRNSPTSCDMSTATARALKGAGPMSDHHPFPPSVLDEIRSRLPVSHVVARKVALKPCGRELKGFSPFKEERSESFVVNDQKGFYHCFASGEHGNIFTFLMRTEGLTFD